MKLEYVFQDKCRIGKRYVMRNELNIFSYSVRFNYVEDMNTYLRDK